MIPGFLIGLLTFPGVIVHEAAHRLFCDLCGVPVYQVCYLRIGNPAGFVAHGHPKSLRSAFLISVGPLIINTILCAAICFSAVVPLYYLEEKSASIVYYFLAWVGLSIGMHAFPSNQDMASFAEHMKRASYRGPFFYVAKLFQGLIFLANLLRFFWFDLIYAAIVALALPLLVIHL